MFAAALSLSGCGGEKSGDVAHGRELFLNGGNGRQACAYCHTIAAAPSHGPFGPKLDNIIR